MRTVWVMLFAVANVLGPWLCCCSQGIELKPEAAAIAKTKLTNCPLCHESAPAKPVEPKSPLKPCPCQSQAKIEVIAIEAKGLSIVSEFSLILSSGVIQDFAGPVQIQSNVAAVVVSEWPFLTAAMRLYVHHVLRC